MNPSDPRQVKRLRDAMNYSRKELFVHRENRVRAIRQYVGRHYSEQGAEDRVPLNLLELAVNIYVRQLAARAPRAKVSTFHPSLRAMASDLEVVVNHRAQEIRLGEVFQDAVLNALFGIGIIKVGLAHNGAVSIADNRYDLGESFAESISLDDWVHDASAKKMSRAAFMGDRYRLPYEAVMESDYYDKRARAVLKPTDKFLYEGGEVGDEQAAELTQTRRGDVDEYEDHVELWDVWLPREGLVVTLPVDAPPDARPLAVVDWEGPAEGPYHRLCFSRVPDNIMPLAPVALWMDLHELANQIYRKLGRQAERQKTLLGVGTGGDADGERIVNASDGDAIRMDDPNKSREYSFGGPDQVTMAFGVHVKDLFSYFGGNLDSLGGLSPQAETLGQEELLAESSSKRVADMQDQTVLTAGSVIRALAWYEWTDPVRELTLEKRVKGTDIRVPVLWTPETREGDFLDYNLSIDPFSMQHQSPAAKLQTIRQVWAEFIAPFADAMAQQGITPNFAELMRVLSEYSNTPELEQILQYASPPELTRPAPRGSSPEVASQPSVTTRRHVRVNRTTGGSRAGRDAVMIQSLLGKGVQPASAPAMGSEGVG